MSDPDRLSKYEAGSLLTSIVALLVSFYGIHLHNRDEALNQRAFRLQYAAVVELQTAVDEQDGVIRIKVRNSGPGPAIIYESGVAYDGIETRTLQPLDSLEKTLTTAVATCEIRSVNPFSQRTTLPPATERDLFVFGFRGYPEILREDPNAALQLIDQFKNATRGIHVVIRYTSLPGETVAEESRNLFDTWGRRPAK